MAKYSKKAQEKVEETMHEMKKGTLKSGSGKKVKTRKQAIAIGLSEARGSGAKAPKKKGKENERETSKKAVRKTTAKAPAKKSAKKSAKK